MIPISQLRVLPGQFWSEKTQLVRNAQRAPDANYRQLIEAAPVVFGWTPGQQQTTLVGICFDGLAYELTPHRARDLA